MTKISLRTNLAWRYGTRLHVLYTPEKRMARLATIADLAVAGTDFSVRKHAVERQRAATRSRAGRRRAAMRQRGLAGFTLVEMMIVVSIIGIFAALAAPSVTRLSRDQRTLKQTLSVMNIYREAKGRALGRGAAVLVRYDATGDTSVTPNAPLWSVYESVDVNGLPFPECVRTKWASAPVAGYGSAAAPIYSIGMGTTDGKSTASVAASVYDNGHVNAAFTFGDVCFSPKGRVFARISSAATPWAELSHMLFVTQRVDPASGAKGLKRGFIVNAIGSARMAEPCQVDAECLGAGETCQGGVCK